MYSFILAPVPSQRYVKKAWYFVILSKYAASNWTLSSPFDPDPGLGHGHPSCHRTRAKWLQQLNLDLEQSRLESVLFRPVSCFFYCGDILCHDFGTIHKSLYVSIDAKGTSCFSLRQLRNLWMLLLREMEMPTVKTIKTGSFHSAKTIRCS